MFHHNWVKTTGRVLDSRIRDVYHRHAGGESSGPSIPLHNYVVEFRAPSPDGKKAIFDHKDSKINVNAVAKARKEADAERFRKQLENDDDVTVNDDAKRDAIAAFGSDAG